MKLIYFLIKIDCNLIVDIQYFYLLITFAYKKYYYKANIMGIFF